MSNDINTQQPAPRVDLPQTRPAPAAQAVDKPRPEPVKAQAPQPQVEKKPDPREVRRQMEEASEQLNRQMAQSKRDLSFSVDDVANKIVLTVKNTEGDVVRQIPSETALKVAHNLADIKGLLQDEKI